MLHTAGEMKRCLLFHSVLFIVTLFVTEAIGSNEHHVDWYTALEKCNATYTSYLIPQSYIEDRNLTHDIVRGIGRNTSAWVDGNIQEIGCNPQMCLRMKRILERNDRKMPYICVTSRGFDINSSEVTYTTAKKLCDSAKLKFKDCHPKYLYEVLPGMSARNSGASVAFWLPNVEFCSNQDIGCVYVISRDDASLETMYGNCSIPKMGVCINKTYISDYQLSFVLEMTVKRFLFNRLNNVGTTKDEEEEEIGSKNPIIYEWAESTSSADAHLQNESVNSNNSELKTFLPFVISAVSLSLVLVSIGITLVVWKR
ncbi:uncharacterized protein LOC125679049 isoform X2 [Ostrea edulis]|nr:uncharacterized protein LOC125679049 isoform X2 [Ostrea edulis]